ncbi:MAG: glycoside hydrolase family 25 protein [Prevotellaceae bacterium]|jgi:lysozyme|nr:glycoside hydrolase family 25 protein [Prevotellaceae bacterium]
MVGKTRLFWILLLLSVIVFAVIMPDSCTFGVHAFDIRMPKGYNLHGIDVSHYQGNLDWTQIENATGGKKNEIKISFAFIKATEGRSITDRMFKENWDKIEKTNLIRGAYHYFIPTRSATEQAQNFIANVKLKKGDLPPVLDVEVVGRYGSAKLKENMKIWLDIVEKHYGMKPIIYSYMDFYEMYLGNDSDFKQYPLWIAHYYKKKVKFKRSWIFWQHNDKGIIPGIDKPMDFNVFNGDLDKLKALCKQ